mmetsp:Transcript_49036/g.110257  ORF Transcript_49036/g.110257 Transcript_49036/m.110257 type:complete len:254 (-) Transcript_49036:40-801(-)
MAATAEKTALITPRKGPVRGFGFGTDEQRKHPKAKYPDSSVDLNCATVDSQPLKYHSTQQVHFGSEEKLGTKNAEIIRVHPGVALGIASPGALEYSPNEKEVVKKPPEYSFGPKEPPATNGKAMPRLSLRPTGAPRALGPGSHTLAPGLGRQPLSARTTAPSHSFGHPTRRDGSEEPRGVFNPVQDFSSLGRQVVGSARSAPQHGFGSATRDNVARTRLVQMSADKGPAERLGKVNFHLDLPAPAKRIAKPGV